MDEPEGENNGKKNNDDEVSLNHDEGGAALVPVNEPDRVNLPVPQNITMPDIW